MVNLGTGLVTRKHLLVVVFLDPLVWGSFQSFASSSESRADRESEFSDPVRDGDHQPDSED